MISLYKIFELETILPGQIKIKKPSLFKRHNKKMTISLPGIKGISSIKRSQQKVKQNVYNNRRYRVGG